ncbi:MAG: MarR family transcriptional regulator [Candidatus Spyradocola sp.]|nr:MarR family transcriptional regulator [Candidatus Spyradocola sp.]
MEREQDEKLKYEMEFTRVIRMYYGRMQAQLAEVGIYRGQPPIMGLLYQHDGMSQKEMASALNLSPATMTVTLKRMEKAGLVCREMDEHDQRILRVHLSEQGRQMWLKSADQIRCVTEELLEGFTPEEERQMREYLFRIARNMERAVEKHGMSDPGEAFEG